MSGFGTLARRLLLLAWLQEGHADLVAIDPGQFATAVREPRRRQEKEELLQLQPLDGALDSEFCARLGNVVHEAVAPPGAVDAHHVRRNPTLEDDACVFAPFACCHAL